VVSGPYGIWAACPRQNRSIIADRSAGIKDRINDREEFRPFCQLVLFERQAAYFDDTFDAPSRS